MEPPRGILRSNKFITHVKKREIIIAWFTTDAIFKFLETIIALTLVACTNWIAMPLSYGDNFWLTVTVMTGATANIILYLGHFFEVPATRWIETLFSIIIGLMSTYSLIQCFHIQNSNQQQEIYKLVLVFLFLYTLLIATDLICVSLCKEKDNCIYRYIEKRYKVKSSEGDKLSRKVKFAVSNDDKPSTSSPRNQDIIYPANRSVSMDSIIDTKDIFQAHRR